MAVRDILQLGDPRLYRVCALVQPGEADALRPVVQDLHDTLLDFRARYGAGRAIAAPQIGVFKRLVYMHVGEPVVFLNPVLDQCSVEMMTLWDDCMSFPDLRVRVRRHRRCHITFRDLAWREHQWMLADDLSELLQHECDHLDGVLAVARAVDGQAFALSRVLQPSAGPVAPPRELFMNGLCLR
jgi:peptide deformylase